MRDLPRRTRQQWQPFNEFVEKMQINPPETLPSGKVDEDTYFKGALGFGDNLYQRSIIRFIAPKYRTFYLETTCPEIYWDIPNIRFVNPGPTRLRTQTKHLAGLPKSTFSEKPPDVRRLPWRYRAIIPRPDGISQCDFLRRSAGMNNGDFDFSFPMKPEWITAAREVVSVLDLKSKKLCLIRPCTARKEWLNPSRNPKVEYIQLLINRYRDEYFYLSFADLEPGQEWLDGELKNIDIEFHKGELSITTLFGLIKISDMVITNPAWVMLAGIAERVKCFTIFGGMAKPQAILDGSMGFDQFSYVAPMPFCHCFKGDHKCKKDIPEQQVINKFEELKNRPYKKEVNP